MRAFVLIEQDWFIKVLWFFYIPENLLGCGSTLWSALYYFLIRYLTIMVFSNPLSEDHICWEYLVLIHVCTSQIIASSCSSISW